MMSKRILLSLAVASLAVLGLTGCPSGGSAPTDPYGGSSPAESPAESDAGSAATTTLTTAPSSLGEIVVDGEGMTVYVFDSDTPDSGASSCEGQCATTWPPVVAGSDVPQLEGVTGEVGTITGVDGEPQVTLNGWPLYYYAGDSVAGDTTGQAVGGIWWVVSPTGEKITTGQ